MKELVTSPTAMEDIAKILKAGKVRSVVQLRNVLANGALFTNPALQRKELLEIIAEVAHATGLGTVLNLLNHPI